MSSFFRRRPLILLFLMAILIAGATAWMVLIIVHAVPPRHVVMTTGPEGGAYRDLGEKYRRVLARFGVRLELRPSLGNVENLERLKDPKSGVSAGFVSGGLTTEDQSPGIVSLGTIGHYPLWVFCRGVPETIQFRQLRGKRISIGPEGGGTRPLVLELLRANEMENAVETVPLSPGPSGEALLAGKIDCACVLTTAEAPVVRKLLADERITLVHFARADGYVARFPYLRKVVVPEGAGNLSADRPPRDTVLIGSTASLLVREDLHPAIQVLLLQAADEIHSPGGILKLPQQFPAPEPVDVPLSSDARSFYRSGGSFLQRHLPFWLWVFATRLLLLLIPLLGIIYPLTTVIPNILNLIVNARLNRLYEELRRIEARIEREGPGPEVVAAFQRLEDKVRHTRTPARHARTLYTLRVHMALVREQLGR